MPCPPGRLQMKGAFVVLHLASAQPQATGLPKASEAFATAHSSG
jgi:hypothetical protein